jgi:uncharacterized membrane protein required for colicin V production
MINLVTVFWLMVGLFALIGALRGWTREVIATAGIILSLFALNLVGPIFVSFLGVTADPAVSIDGEAVRRRQFYLLALIHLIITFVSYQGPVLAGSRLVDRLRVRDSIQDKVMGALVGAINGYLVIGTLWSFLEYVVGPGGGYVPLTPGVNYPFDPSVLIRPGVGGMPPAALVSRLPLPLLAPYLPYLVVIVFLFVIVVMI